MPTILESCHQLHRRKQFEGAKVTFESQRRITTANCGCINITKLSKLGPTADGVTYTCEKHSKE